ncbi:TRAP transporter permease [Arhodomonas sp. AD133]|uniref:TRAP transporter permease n=1 Tax=Arhodomonas sp. AD133 TaxID=3415009 RepID=UPI003EB9B52C
MSAKDNETRADAAKLEEMLQAEGGGRAPPGVPAAILFAVPLVWSLFQIWYASPWPFVFGFGIFNSTEARAIHLAFAMFLAFTGYPALKRSPRRYIPIHDWVLALLGAASAAYLYVFYDALAQRPGDPTTYDLWIAVVGMVLLLEATRRALGPPLMVVALVFLTYAFAGPYMPDVISHGGISLSKAASHYWLGTEGVFGVALGVSTDFVFLFVLFGAILEHAGAGNYFIKVAFSMLGHLRGGPAKAAVVASGLSGIISGSSIANVVTTGTFTIPLMKRVGFPATKAGAVEVAASTNGQLTPPIMGAAAFLMVEYVGISYLEVIKHALLPALISYIALIYIVHLEATKAGMKGLPRRHVPSWLMRVTGLVGSVLGIIVLSFAVYYGVGWTKDVFGPAATWIVGIALVAVYLALLWVASRQPRLDEDTAEDELEEVPDAGPILLSGLYFLLPVAVLIWCLMVERFSPGLSAFWALMFMIIIAVTHRPILAVMRRDRALAAEALAGGRDLLNGMVGGARNMIGIGVATAAAGIVVGTVTVTGIGLVMTAFVEFISGGSLILMLLFTAVISLLLGMGLPTTANYIVVSTLMAPVIVELGAQHGLIVPLIAVHLFVFYFGILADDTPPVGLAAFAASAISGADPIRTGVQGFTYDIRTAVLPFMFIFNTKLLLIGLAGWFDLVVVVVSALVAILVFAAATQGYWLTRTRWYETVGLLLIAFTMFRPGFWWDELYAPYEDRSATEVFQVAESLPSGSRLALHVEGLTVEGEEISKVVALPIEGEGDGRQRLQNAGVTLSALGDRVTVQNVMYGSPAQKMGLDFGFRVTSLRVPADRPPKELMFIPALALLALIGWLQYRRRERRGMETPAVSAGQERAR